MQPGREPTTPNPKASEQLFKQRLGLLKSTGAKPLREPVVDVRKQVVGFCPLPLLLPQEGRARRGPKLPVGAFYGTCDAAMVRPERDRFTGEVTVDETYVGGEAVSLDFHTTKMG